MYSEINDSYNNIKTTLISINDDRRPTKRRKILVLGSPGVGKSAIIMRFKDDIFLDYYDPTIHSTIKKMLFFNNENVELEIIDIDGQTEYTIFSFSKFSFGIHGYLLCYSIENRQSFELLKVIHSKLVAMVGRDVPKVLVANKCDLLNRREIVMEEGKAFAKKINCPFLECSAKSNLNINKVFHSMLVEINKFESNVDLKGFTCKKLIELFVKKENILINFFYILMIINILLGVLDLIYGFYIGIRSFVNNSILIGGILLIGLWEIIFTILGYYGINKKKNEFINYFKIGLILAIIFTIITLMINFFTKNADSPEINIQLYKEIYFNVIIPIKLFLNSLLLFFSFMFERIYKYDLSSYIVV